MIALFENQANKTLQIEDITWVALNTRCRVTGEQLFPKKAANMYLKQT